MADQIDIRPLQGRRLMGFVGNLPVAGPEQSQPVDLILINGVQIGTSPHDPRAPIFLTRQLSPAEAYAIQQAVAKHHGTTQQKATVLPINHGHHKKRVPDAEVQAALQRRYRRG